MPAHPADEHSLSLRHLRAFLDSAVEGFVVIDEAGRIVEWNTAAERTFGWPRAQAVGREMAELLVPEAQRAAHRRGMARYLDGGGGRLMGRRIEVPALRRDGSEVPVELTLSELEVDGRRHFAASLHDVSERKAAEARQRRLADVIDAAGDAILSGRLDGTIETFNPAAERLYGYRADEIVGRSVALLRPEGHIADFAAARDRLRAGDAVSLETRERRKDGSLIDVAVTLSPLRDAAGEVVGIASVVRDVSERNRAAAQLREARARFEGAFRAAATGMAVVALDGTFLDVNGSLCELLEREPDQLLATSFQALTHPDDLTADLDELARLVAGESEGYTLAKRYLLPGGGIVWGLLTVSLVRGRDGTPLHFVAQIQDVTARKTAEAELERYTQHLHALSEHDPATGLNSSRAFSAALADEVRAAHARDESCGLVFVRADDDAELPAVVDLLREGSRDSDVAAHLADGVLALLLPGADADAVVACTRRLRSAARGACGLRCAGVTLEPDETPEQLVARARAAVSDAPPVPSAGAGRLERLLEHARAQLGMPLSFVSRHDGEVKVFTALSGDHARFGLQVGDTMPAEQSHCRRMLDGDIASTVGDLAADPVTRDMPITRATGLRAYAGVPIRLADGSLFGTLCAVDVRPHPQLGAREAELLRFVAELVAEVLEHDAKADRARRDAVTDTGVRALLGALEARDFYTGEHSREVVALAVAVARRLGLAEDAVRDVEQVALLHDIGKVGIPDAILQKQGPLDQREWTLMRQHPVVGERIIAGTAGLGHLAPAMRAEHERWDGDGYPDGLRGEDIPVASRITLACDAYHAMTSDRPYRPRLSERRAQEELRGGAGTQFDPSVVDALLAELGPPPADAPRTTRAARAPSGAAR